MKYASGQAIMLSPAFFVANLFCNHTNYYPSDGFSMPYQFSIWLWCLILSFIGVCILRKILLFYFTDLPVAITLFSIVLCTNYFEYSAISGSLSHSNLFTVYTLLVFFVIKFYRNPSAALSLIIGVLCGLATITRPTEILSLIIPLFWGITNKEDIKLRLMFFVKHYFFFFLAILSFTVMIFIQLIYWKWVSGDWFVYSYQKEGFDWLHPHIYKCLFSVKAGWLLYSPVMVFAIFGLGLLYKTKKILFFVCLLFLIPFTYLCFSWSEWWYGWSLGQRAMIQSYPIWALCLCAFYQYIFTIKRKFVRFAIIPFLLLFLTYNVWLVFHCHTGGLFKGPEMTRAYFFAILGKTKVEPEVMFLLDNADRYPFKIKQPKLIYFNNFNSDSSVNLIATDSLCSEKQIKLSEHLQFTNEYTIKNEGSIFDWYLISADLKTPSKEWDTWKMSQFIVKFYKGDSLLKENMIRVHRILVDNETKNIRFFAKKPCTSFDRITLSFYNAQSTKTLLIDNLKIKGLN
jgi:hypothetical protein